MSEVERVEGTEVVEVVEGIERAEVVESYRESVRFRIYPLNTLQSAFDQLSRSALPLEEKHLRLCQKPKVRARWSKKCQHIEVR